MPHKYLLTYEYGYNELYDAYKKHQNEKKESSTYYEYELSETKEDVQNDLDRRAWTKSLFTADTKGRLIHSVLEKDLPVESIAPFIRKYFNSEMLDDPQNDLKTFLEIIFKELTTFYSSETYRKLKSEPNYQNEFQVYLKEKDFYLFGIIDKVIFTEDSIRIIDYKTDNITVEQLAGRAHEYFLQLTFYAFILTKLFPQKDKIVLQIIFTKFPDNLFSHEVTSDELIQLESFVLKMTTKIRKKEFSKTLSHCRQCHFADRRNSCIF